MPRPEHPFGNPQEPSHNDEGFDQPFDMPDAETGHSGETLIGNSGEFAEAVGFGENGV
jgi:hypothetical protein